MRQAQFTRTAKTANSKSSTPSAGTSNTTTASSSPCGCGCHDHAGETCGCCKLACFERPKYFCGQLLSDADLTLQETYFREKNRLYHRTMDGFGVVCGLRMYYDSQCRGHLTIGDGYAIDACGNDLVVCDPYSFDVIGELRKKKWLVEAASDRTRMDQSGDYRKVPDGEGKDDCINTQCFYIGICYTEEPVDFASPYTTECNPVPGPCQPTRIREGVRFEIYDKMPVRPNPLDDIGKRIEHCFKMFRDGQFSRSLANLTPRILEVLPSDQQKDSQRQKESDRQDVPGLFKEVQAQFLHELRTCPDQYNCDLEREVYRLRPPDQNKDGKDTGVPSLEAFTRLFELIQKYVFSCVLAQLAFSCPEPPSSSCVLIGSVEIENGCLTRVINYPRWYLWCFANFFQVLLYSMANDAACGKDQTQTAKSGEEGRKPVKSGCCPAHEIDVRQFLHLFHADPCALEKATRTSVDAIQASYRALVAGFNFTRPGGIAPGVLRNLEREKAHGLAKMLGLHFEPSTGEAGRSDVFAALADNTIHFSSDTLVYDTDDSKDDYGSTVSQVNGVMGAPAFAVGPYTHKMFTDIMERLTYIENILDVRGKPKPPSKPDTPPSAPPAPPPPPVPPRGGGVR
jgi:hypothetical protein